MVFMSILSFRKVETGLIFKKCGKMNVKGKNNSKTEEKYPAESCTYDPSQPYFNIGNWFEIQDRENGTSVFTGGTHPFKGAIIWVQLRLSGR